MSVKLASLILEYDAVVGEHDYAIKQFKRASIQQRKDLLSICRNLLRRARALREMAKVQSEMDKSFTAHYRHFKRQVSVKSISDLQRSVSWTGESSRSQEQLG